MSGKVQIFCQMPEKISVTNRWRCHTMTLDPSHPSHQHLTKTFRCSCVCAHLTNKNSWSRMHRLPRPGTKQLPKNLWFSKNGCWMTTQLVCRQPKKPHRITKTSIKDSILVLIIIIVNWIRATWRVEANQCQTEVAQRDRASRINQLRIQ